MLVELGGLKYIATCMECGKAAVVTAFVVIWWNTPPETKKKKKKNMQQENISAEDLFWEND